MKELFASPVTTELNWKAEQWELISFVQAVGQTFHFVGLNAVHLEVWFKPWEESALFAATRQIQGLKGVYISPNMTSSESLCTISTCKVLHLFL